MQHRRFVVVVVAASFAAVTTLVGLVTNAASSHDRWPGWLQLMNGHPWISLGVLAAVAIALAVVVAWSSDTSKEAPDTQSRHLSAEDRPETESTVARTNNLPRDSSTFTGRSAELAAITEAVEAARAAGRTIPIIAIEGMAGIGKTALAVHIGHQLADQFPDGQLFVDLHGHTPGHTPVEPSAALELLLIADGVAPYNVPTADTAEGTLVARTAMWRARLAPRRVLLILDNATSHRQVTPLLPAGDESLVVVTSRHRLAALTAVTQELDVLPEPKAKTLLTQLSPRLGSVEDDRAVAELVELCGRLPLALSLLAGFLRHHASWPLGRVVEGLRFSADRLTQLRAEDSSVAAAFEISYQGLPDARRRHFRRLGLHLTNEFDVHASAALDGIPLVEAQEHLDALHADHLVKERSAGRYQLHDLVRYYAATLAADDDSADRDAAVERLLNYYQQVSSVASKWLTQHTRVKPTEPVTPPREEPEIASRRQALVWCEAERGNLLASIAYALARSHHDRAPAMISAMAAFLRSEGPWSQAVTLHSQAVATLEGSNDKIGQAEALNDLGVAERLLDSFDAGLRSLERAAELFSGERSRLGEANTSQEIGVVLFLMGDFSKAMTVLQSCVSAYQEISDPLGEANALHELGNVHFRLGNFAEAESSQISALAQFRELGDQLGEGDALHELGNARHRLGEHHAADQAFEQSLEIFRDLPDRLGQAYVLNDQGAARLRAGDAPGAERPLHAALEIYRSIGSKLGECEVLNNLGRLALASEPAAAERLHEQALGIARSVGIPLEEARALKGLGESVLAQGNDDGATHLRTANEIFARIRSSAGAPGDDE